MNEPAAYSIAQRGLAELKVAVYELLRLKSGEGLTNSEIGRMLGIYYGHKGHEGHVSRTVLSSMESEGAVQQEPTTKRWSLRTHGSSNE